MANARYWVGVCYPENMLDGWQDKIGDLLQVPFAYCVHDADTTASGDDRKEHVHIMLVYPNTTTYNHALNTMHRLSADGKACCNKVEQVIGVRNQYDYLIHDTEACRKAYAKGDNAKHPYPKERRIEGNNFDIGAYEQISLADKRKICRDFAKAIVERQFMDFLEFYEWVLSEYEEQVYFDVCMGNSGFLERLCKGNYLRYRRAADDEQLRLSRERLESLKALGNGFEKPER